MSNPTVEAYKDKLERVASAAIREGYAAVLKNAQEIGANIKNATPRKTGKLAESVRLETDPAKGRVTIKAGGSSTQTAQHTDYALHQEYGTSDQPANPFFWPMWRLGRKKAKSAINKAMKTAIEREMGR